MTGYLCRVAATPTILHTDTGDADEWTCIEADTPADAAEALLYTLCETDVITAAAIGDVYDVEVQTRSYAHLGTFRVTADLREPDWTAELKEAA